MSNSVMVGQEKVAHGTEAAAYSSVPCLFLPKEQQKNTSPEEVRNSQDVHFTRMAGLRWLEWEVKESPAYHDTFGLFLASAIGAPVSSETQAGVVFDNVFKFTADPRSLSLKWDDPRRSADPLKALYNVVDEMTVTFKPDGSVMYSCSGVGMPPASIAAPTYSFSTTKPIEAWRGAVTLDGSGSYLKLVSGQIKISRGRKPFHSIANSQSPQRMSTGKRTVDLEMVIDFSGTGELADWRDAAATAGLIIEFIDDDVTIGSASNPEIEFTLGTLLYEDIEKDWEPEEPQIKVTAKGLYDTSDASTIVARIQSTVDYE